MGCFRFRFVFFDALQPKVETKDDGILWIQKNKAATLIDIDTNKILFKTDEDKLQFCKNAFVRCLEEIRLRNIGGMILIDFPRIPKSKKKILNQYIIDMGKNYFLEGSFLGFSKLQLYEIYVPRNFPSLESFFVDEVEYEFQNHLRSLWRKSIETQSKNKIQFLCGKNLYKKIKNEKLPPFIKIIQRSDFQKNYGELMEMNK